ncbi:MAG: hypothetical protein AAGJ81_09330 [Verrucomicrobiota bacterium]
MTALSRLVFTSFFVQSLPMVLGGAVTDLHPLDPDSPAFDLLYSDVQVGNPTATGTGFKEGYETLNAAYAYLHPQSPHQYDPDYLARLRALLDARMSRWQQNEGIDITSSFGTAYAYLLMKYHRPDDISDKIEEWDDSVEKMGKEILKNTLLYEDHILANGWLNGDIRLALGLYTGGAAIDNVEYQEKASEAIDMVLSQAVVGDGASHYVGFNTEVATYRDTTINSFLWWWTLTGSPKAKAALDKTIPYVPLSVEPSGFQEQSTGIPYKHSYNGIRGRGAALATAYLYGDRYNYFFGSQKENSYNPEYSLLYAIHYREGLEPQTPPSNFMLYDRAIMGPRGRWEDWAVVANGRDPQTPEPDHPDQGYDGRMGGKNTFVGALAVGSWENNTSLKAALDGVCPEFKNRPGTTDDWARGANTYRFLSQDEETSTITRKTFGSLATRYRLSTRRSAGATEDWGKGTDWLGEQVWLLTGDRLVGLVQIYNETAATVFGLNTRISLVGGRYPILGRFYELDELSPNEFRFGELQLRIPEENFGGGYSQERFSVNNHPSDDRAVMLRLHAVEDERDDSAIEYRAGTRRYAVIECIQEDRSFSEKAENLLPNDEKFAVLEVTEEDRKFRLVQNLTDETLKYSGEMDSGPGTSVSLHKSWSADVRVADFQPPISLNMEIPPYEHAVVVVSSEEKHHDAKTQFYEDIFTEG